MMTPGPSDKAALCVALFASGAGSTLGALLDARDANALEAEICLLITSRADAAALEVADRRNVPWVALDERTLGRDTVDEAMLGALVAWRIDLIVLAGYTRKIGPKTLAAYHRQIINTHPAPLPRFGGQGMYGEHVHRAVLESGVTQSAATVHLVDAEYDTGTVIATRSVAVKPDDDVVTLRSRVQIAERSLLIDTINGWTRWAGDHRPTRSARPVQSETVASRRRGASIEDDRAQRTGVGSERGGIVQQMTLGTRAQDEIDAILDRFCLERFGSAIATVLFRETSVGAVTAVALADGRRLVIKVHQPRETMPRLQAVHAIQLRLHRSGFPCPEPLIEPVGIAHGHATAETLLDHGQFLDTHDPTCRRLIAEALAWHLQITADDPPPQALAGGWDLFDPDRLWPADAHSPVFDFEATAAGGEWIDRLATQAKDAIDPAGGLIAGHSDWSGKHFRFAEDTITAVYDWDSLSVRTEAAILGIAAVTRFDLPGVSRAPAPDEMAAFLDEYSNARSTPLIRTDRRQAAAWALLLAAYTARCEHCRVNGYEPDADSDSFTASLRTYGWRYLEA